MSAPLTPTQARVLEFIAQHIVEKQRPPTRKEISRHFGWSAVNSAEDHIKALAAKGHIALGDSGDGGQGARYPRVVCWPDSLLPILRVGYMAAVLADAPRQSIAMPCLATNEA